jgi:hypothetical protein
MEVISENKNQFKIIKSELFPGTMLEVLKNIKESIYPFLHIMTENVILDLSLYSLILVACCRK